MAIRVVYSGGDGTVGTAATLTPTAGEWATAYQTLAAAAAVDTAGDTILVAHDHAENNTAAVLHAWASTSWTSSAWTRVLCVNRTTNAVTTGATIKTTGNYAITCGSTGQGLVFDGLTYLAGDTATGSSGITLGQSAARVARYDNCVFDLRSTASNTISVLNSGRMLLNNVSMKFGNAGGKVTNATVLEWSGGGLLSGTLNTELVTLVASSRVSLANLDLSAAPSTLNVFSGTSNIGAIGVIRNSKLPASWTGSVSSAEPTVPSTRVSLYNCDSGNTNYRLIIKDFSGTITSETTVVRTGGATDGTTPISWRMVGNANANDSLYPLVSDPIAIWNETTGSSVTVTVEILHDSVTDLTDAEVWLTVEALTTSGYPLGVVTTDHRADVLATAAAQATSTATWTTTGLTNPNKQKLSFSITPQVKGLITARVNLAKGTSYTIYVDPEITVT